MTLHPLPQPTDDRDYGLPWQIVAEQRQLMDHLPRARSQYVYVVEANGLYKIGTTRRAVFLRVEEIQTSCPYKVTEIGHAAGGFVLEHALHSMFAECRVQGEWFRLSDDQVALIRRLLVPLQCIADPLAHWPLAGLTRQVNEADEADVARIAKKLNALEEWVHLARSVLRFAYPMRDVTPIPFGGAPTWDTEDETESA